MAVITKIQVQKNNKDRVNVYLDDEFAFACSNELVYYHGLQKNLEIDENKLKDIVKEDNYIKGKNVALKILERSYKTEKEIYDKLVQREYDVNTINRVLEFLREYSFVDDVKFTKLYIKEKIKSLGKIKIKYMLINKGIDEDIINSEINKISSDDEYESAFKIGYKKYNLLYKSEKNSIKIRKKLFDFLVRNGFNFDIANKVTNKLVTESDLEYVQKEEQETDYDELINIGTKRLNILLKSEKDTQKIKKKLQDYLLRRGYSYDEIKSVIRQIVK